MSKLIEEIRAWWEEMNRMTRFGTVVVIVGAVIDLFYHGVLSTVLPLPAMQANVVQYAGHGITFAGMLVMLLGVVVEGWKHSRGAPAPAPARRESRSSE